MWTWLNNHISCLNFRVQIVFTSEHMLDHTKHRAPRKYFHKSFTKKKNTNGSLKLFKTITKLKHKNANITTKWQKTKHYCNIIKKSQTRYWPTFSVKGLTALHEFVALATHFVTNKNVTTPVCVLLIVYPLLVLLFIKTTINDTIVTFTV